MRRLPGRRTYLCWRGSTTMSSMPGPRRSRARAACASPRGSVKPVAELIRFVVGPGRRRGPRRQAQAARAGRLGDGDPGGGCRGGRPPGVRAAASSARCGLPPTSPDVTEQLLERAALDALAIAHKARQVVARLRQGRGGTRRAARWWPWFTPPMRARTGSASSLPRLAAPVSATERPGRWRSICSPRRNWIWHWAGQM